MNTSKKIEIELETPWALMNPGPINLTDKVRLALTKPDLCHREPEFQTLMGSVRQKIVQVFDVENDYTVALVAGSGTAAVEAMIASGAPEDGATLVIENGVYGERIAKICSAMGIDVVPFHLDWGEAIDFDKLETVIKENQNIRAIAAIHHETTTGLINDIEKVGAVAQKHNLTFFCDSVSGLAAEELDIKKAGLAMVACTANKAIHGVPGISFVLIRKDYLQTMQDIRVRSVYFDLRNYIANQEAGSIPFTMPVHVLYAFEAALEELEAETVAGRIARFKKRSARVREGLKDHFEFYLPLEDFSNTMTSFKLPDGLDYQSIHAALKKNHIVVYAGQGGLSKSIFRIAHIGEYDDDVVLPVLFDTLLNLRATVV